MSPIGDSYGSFQNIIIIFTHIEDSYGKLLLKTLTEDFMSPIGDSYRSFQNIIIIFIHIEDSYGRLLLKTLNLWQLYVQNYE